MNDIYLSMVLDGLSELSDKDFQDQVWLPKTPNMQSSLTESTEKLYSDSGYDIILEKQGAVFDDKIDSLLEELSKSLANTGYDIFTAEDINSSGMDAVREKAKVILELLQKKYK